MPPRPGPGRPPKLDGPSQLIAVRMPLRLLQQLDRYVQQRMGAPATRADALRWLLQRALADADREQAEVRTTARQLAGLLRTPRPRRSRTPRG